MNKKFINIAIFVSAYFVKGAATMVGGLVAKDMYNKAKGNNTLSINGKTFEVVGVKGKDKFNVH